MSPRRKRQVVALSFVAVASALAELVSLGSVLPFLAVLTEPERIWLSPWVRQIAALAGWASPSQLLTPAASVFALAAVITAGIRLLNLWLGGRLAAAIGSDLSCEVYRRTLFQPYAVHVQRNSGTVINAITAQIGTAVAALNQVVVTTTATLVATFLLVGMLLINWGIAIASAGVFGAAYLLIGFYGRKTLADNGRAIDKARTGVLKALQEGLGAIRDVLLDGTQLVYLEIYRKSDRPQRRFAASNQFLSAFPRFFLEALGLLFIAFLAGLLVVQKGSGPAALPVLGAFALGAQRLLPSLQQSYAGWSSLKSYNAELSGVLAMLEQPLPAVAEQVQPFDFKRAISLKGVKFRYALDAPSVLSSLSIDVAAGERVGVVGSTGSGKSTAVDLLMGLLDPTEGEIFVDGLPLHDPAHPERLLAWRAAIAHVPQSIYLADSTIAENIAFGVPTKNIDYSRVRLAAEQAQIASFIEASPEGYDSFVGERGIRLSGGQRQRLGIARALYKQASVLILDEATSALDTATELSVMEAINQLSRNLTVVMIAHRLSTVSQCDRVIRLEQGRVVADGPPSEVLALS